LRSPDLVRWAHQGVLLLNTVLTVEQGQPASHAGKGWEALTNMVIRSLFQRSEPLVFMAWGAQAQVMLADVPHAHLLLQANHPSPLSASRPPRPFVGCGHFGQANRWLISRGREPLAW
jgi:uracil-DNA glycosylase